MDPIEKFRAEFADSHAPPNPERIHCNNAGVSPISRVAFETATRWLKRFAMQGSFDFGEVLAEAEKTRQDVARFLGASSHEVAFLSSTTSGVAAIAAGFPFQPGDEILLWDQEYPANFYPWSEAARRTGAKLVLVSSDENLATPTEALLARVSERTKLIAFSWVQFKSGAITDLRQISQFARARGIFTFSDVIQGVGLLPFDFRASGLDAVAGGAHKWLSSPAGVSYLAVREEHIGKLMPMIVGAGSTSAPDTEVNPILHLKDGMERFEAGSIALQFLFSLGAAMNLCRDVGVERLAQETEWLSRRLVHGLREAGYKVFSPHGQHHRGSIVNFGPATDSRYQTNDTIANRLTQNHISFAKRPPGGIRLSPHAFNTADEISRILDVLRT